MPETEALVSGNGHDQLIRRDVSLREIRSVVEDDLAAFRKYFRESVRSSVGLLDKVTQYMLRQKGKEVRP
ncbi:MAG: hypothetical protein WD275_02195, partial [Rhodothermales bacterium]